MRNGWHGGYSEKLMARDGDVQIGEEPGLWIVAQIANWQCGLMQRILEFLRAAGDARETC